MTEINEKITRRKNNGKKSIIKSNLTEKKNNKRKHETGKNISPETRHEVIKFLYYYQHKNMSEIATELTVDKSTICRDMKKIRENFKLNPLDIDELAAVIRFRCEKRQKELILIYEKSPNPYVRISCLRQCREEDRNLIDLLGSIGSLRQSPVYAEKKLPIQIILTNEKPESMRPRKEDKGTSSVK